MNHKGHSLYQIFTEAGQTSLSAQEQYEHRLNEYVLEEKKLIRQKELLEARKERIQALKGRYNFGSE